MHITFHSYSLSLFFLQIKPFYTDTFYLHKLLELSPKTMELTPKAAEIKQTGKKTLTIRQERFRDTNKIFLGRV